MENRDARRHAPWVIGLVLAGALVAFAFLALRSPVRAVSRARETVEEGCALIQTLRYARCGHEVTRRVTADKEYKGCTLAQMQQAFAEWDVTSFSPSEIEMSRTLPLYCPDHLVVMPDGGGILGVYENTYGEGYTLRAQLDVPVSDLPDALRESIHLGLSFQNDAEIESWLETLES